MTAATMATASVGVVVITHRARDRIARCLAPLQASPLRPRILVVNSSSCDGTVEAAEELGADTMTVPRWRFNHGLTRELADPCHKALIGRSPCECDVVMVLDRHAVVNESPESTATGVLDRWPHFETLSDSSQTPEQHSDVFYLRTVTFG